MVFRYLDRPRGGSTRAFDTDVLAWEAAVVANGGSVSLARRIILDQFVFSEKASGAWALTDDYWGLWGENAPQALTSLKRRVLAVATNSPVFTADRDYTFDGVTNYVDLIFSPATHAVAMSLNNCRIAAYARTNVTSSGFDTGAASASNRALRINTRSAGNCLGLNNTNTSTYTLPAADSRGYAATGWNGTTAADCYGYKNGVAMVRTGDATTFGSSAAAVSMFAGGYNNVGALAAPRAASLGFITCGATLSGAQELAQYNAVQAWATSIGAQV